MFMFYLVCLHFDKQTQGEYVKMLIVVINSE